MITSRRTVFLISFYFWQNNTGTSAKWKLISQTLILFKRKQSRYKIEEYNAVINWSCPFFVLPGGTNWSLRGLMFKVKNNCEQGCVPRIYIYVYDTHYLSTLKISRKHGVNERYDVTDGCMLSQWLCMTHNDVLGILEKKNSCVVSPWCNRNGWLVDRCLKLFFALTIM